MGGDGRGNRGDDYRVQVTDGKRAEDHLHSEHHSGDWSVEACTDTGTGSGSDEASNAIVIESCVPGER